MKTIQRSYLSRLPRVVKTGALLGATIFAASALQAQSANQNPAGQTPNAQYPLTQDPATQDRTLPQSPSTIAPSGGVSHRSKEFLKEAAQANQTEIAMANVALGKSQNTQVKDFAQMLRNDHEKNLADLQSIAQFHGVTIENGPDWTNRREIDHLQKANDADFDRDYAKVMLKDHVKCIKRFDKAAADIDDQDVKQYALNTLPALRRHLRHSEDVARAVGLDESTISSILRGLPNEDQAVTIR